MTSNGVRQMLRRV